MFYNPIEDKVLGKDVLFAVASDNPNVNKIKENTTYSEARNILSKGIKRKTPTHIFIGSNKGGVGKSMTALQVAWFLNARGYKVLLADLDAQANITCSLLEDGTKTEADKSFYDVLTGEATFDQVISHVSDGFDLMGANQKLSEVDYFLRSQEANQNSSYFDRDKTQSDQSNEVYLQTYKIFKKLGENYDFIIYDTNPETNKFNRLSMQVCDIALVPMQAKESSAKAYMVTLTEINDSFISVARDASDIEDRVKLLFNNNDYIPEKKKEKIINKIYKHFSGSILNEYIEYSYELGEASDVGWPAFAHNEIPLEIVENISNVVDEVIELADSVQSVRSTKKRRHMFLSDNA